MLVELAQHISEIVREIIDIEPAVADQTGQAIVKRIIADKLHIFCPLA